MNADILVVDIGNTSTSYGLFRKGRVAVSHRIPRTLQDAAVIVNALNELLRPDRLKGAILCSVVPRVNALWRLCIHDLTGEEPLVLDHRFDLGIDIPYPNPETIGPDRLANACGGANRYGVPVVVADFGTALTFDLVTKRGYEGGIIAPGLPLMFDYLAEKTALLPHIEYQNVRGPVGKNTVDAMRLGAKVGYRGMAKALFEYVRESAGGEACTLCATGGYAGRVLRGLDLPVRLDKLLTLYGLGVAFELNR